VAAGTTGVTVCVFGLWHLGTVTAACLAAAGIDTVGLDINADVVETLSRGVPPLFEPGLEELIKKGLASRRLRFTADPTSLSQADVVWIAIDTPVDEDDRADSDSVVHAAATLFPHLRSGTLVLTSSQLPVGSTGRLERMFAASAAGRKVDFAYSPENLRLGTAIDAFTTPDRIVVGVRNDRDRDRIKALLRPFTDRVIWMSVESAEMTKHALNAFLAASVAFINEIAVLCEQTGADAGEVERGLKSEPRIGPKAYLSPGGAFAGGTLARDVNFLSSLGAECGVSTTLLSAVKTSNDAHREWAQLRLAGLLGDVKGKRIAVWGLTYKPGTDTLRRSPAVELCRWVHAHGGLVCAHDPVVTTVPPDLRGLVQLTGGPLDAVRDADALVVATLWPDFRAVAAADVRSRMRGSIVLDANRFLAATLGDDSAIRYFTVGRGA
jgi:UDPglucose 6-dehydrogenase